MYKKLTDEGKAFIKKICSGDGNSLISGHVIINKTPVALPYCTPPSHPNKIWKSYIPLTSGTVDGYVTTNSELGDLLIKWYDKYGSIYQMDANILAAQAFAESGYRTWTYAIKSTASGISQFKADTITDVIFKNFGKSQSNPPFTQEEIDKIQKNIIGNTNDMNTYFVKNPQGRENREIMHQNIIDNPDLMIKAQYRYMKYISSLCDGLAATTLFGYSRGQLHAKKTYTESITSAKNYDPGSEKEGVNYVKTIFTNLYKNFGYNGKTTSVDNKVGVNLMMDNSKYYFNPLKANALESLRFF